MPQSSTVRVGVLEVFKGLPIFVPKPNNGERRYDPLMDAPAKVATDSGAVVETRNTNSEDSGVKRMALQ